jgi:signal transduction histidine kinase/DNA-binding response OmpR family regulator
MRGDMEVKPKILIVDDKVQNLISLEVLLEDMNVDFVRALSGQEALEKTLSIDFALALLDVQMPEMDGFETVELMRQVKKTKNLPVIFVSAIYSEDFHIIKGIESGAVDFISKPIIPEILRGKVKVFLDLNKQKQDYINEIEKRKRIEKELITKEKRLIEEELRFRELFENSPISIWEEDFSEVHKYINVLKEKGIDDFRKYFNENPDEITKCTSKVKIININETTVNMFHAKNKEDLLKQLDSVFTEDSLETFKYQLLTIAAGETEYEGECVNKTVDGKEINVFLKWSASLGFEESYERVLVNLIDITDQKKADEDRLRLYTEAENANNELKNFAYMVSHDLKAPLRAINSLAEWISEDYAEKLDEDGIGQLHLLQDRVKVMHDLLEGILEYSRAGRIDEEDENLDLNEIINSIIDILSPPDSIKFQIKKNFPKVSFGPTKITKVLKNIISNSIMYMDKPDGIVEIGFKIENKFITISIKDNGPGIDEKHFNKIFEMFQTIDSKVNNSKGVGLSTAKKIVQDSGGEIWLESETGKGTTFFVMLPIIKG